MRLPYPVITVLFLLLSCTTVDVHIKKRPPGKTIRTILLDRFEQRTLGYDPYVAANFRDALAFELFKRGYTVVAPPETLEKRESASGRNDGADGAPEKTDTVKLVRQPLYDLRIGGVLSESRWGDTVRSRTGVVITVTLILPDGVKLGEARCGTSQTLSDPSSLRTVARALAEKIARSVGR